MIKTLQISEELSQETPDSLHLINWMSLQTLYFYLSTYKFIDCVIQKYRNYILCHLSIPNLFPYWANKNQRGNVWNGILLPDFDSSPSLGNGFNPLFLFQSVAEAEIPAYMIFLSFAARRLCVPVSKLECCNQFCKKNAYKWRKVICWGKDEECNDTFMHSRGLCPPIFHLLERGLDSSLVFNLPVNQSQNGSRIPMWNSSDSHRPADLWGTLRLMTQAADWWSSCVWGGGGVREANATRHTMAGVLPQVLSLPSIFFPSGPFTKHQKAFWILQKA